MEKGEIISELKSLGSKFEDPKIQRRFKEYNKTIQFSFPDIGVVIYMRIGDASLDEIGEGEVEAELAVTMDSTMLKAILSREESPMAAYSTGKLKTKGEVPDLLKLQKLLL